LNLNIKDKDKGEFLPLPKISNFTTFRTWVTQKKQYSTAMPVSVSVWVQCTVFPFDFDFG